MPAVKVTNENARPLTARQQESRKNGGGSSKKFRSLTLSIFKHTKICTNIHMLKNASCLLGRQNQHMIISWVKLELRQRNDTLKVTLIKNTNESVKNHLTIKTKL